MSPLLIKPAKCSICGEYAVFHGIFGKLGTEWMGERCSACGWELIDETATVKMYKHTKTLRELMKKELTQDEN